MDPNLEKLTRKIPIGALQAGCNTALVVAAVIHKSDPRRVISRKDGQERWVTTFTLRDSPVDIINLTVWSGREEAASLKQNYHIGEVVEVVRPRITQKDANNQYSPAVTSWLQLTFVDGKSLLAPHLGDTSALQALLRIPSKGSSAFLSVADILTSQSLRGHYVDILAAVRSVAPEKKFPGKEGDLEEERSVREVRLFDQTADCLVLKLWDSELIRLSCDWIPRDHVLFLADVRIGWDAWRGSLTLVSTSRTLVTVNPDTKEAASLLRHAQLADFSSVSRLDQFVSGLDPRTVTRVANVAMVEAMMTARQEPGQESLAAVTLYGYITRFDADCCAEETVSLHCGACSGLLRPQPDTGHLGCGKLECPAPDTGSPSQKFSVRADVSDETGSLASVKMAPALLERVLGPPGDFVKLSDQTRTGYKWRVMLKPLKMTLALLLPTPDRSGHCMVVDMSSVTLEEITVKMPSPAII